MDQMRANGTGLDGASWLAWTSWAEGSVSVQYDSMTLRTKTFSMKETWINKATYLLPGGLLGEARYMQRATNTKKQSTC